MASSYNYVNGRLVLLNPVTAGSQADAAALEEEQRVVDVMRRRAYFDGSQHDDEAYDENGVLVAEEDRKHAYSSQIRESVEYMANQLSDDWRIDTTQAIEDVVNATFASNDRTEDGIEDVLVEALETGDVGCLLDWDVVDGHGTIEFWESETTQFEWSQRGVVSSVTLRQVIWVYDDQDAETQVIERTIWSYELNPAGEIEVLIQKYWDDEDGPRSIRWTGLPVIPWVLLRANSGRIRQQRGASVITDQAMRHADRYNEIESYGFTVARYNSHARVVITGDSAHLQLGSEGTIKGDVADVLTFPGGTDVTELKLESDPTMIENQRTELERALYSEFGLVPIDIPHLQSHGQLSGYALEILNRKTDGTFRKVRRRFGRDLVRLVQKLLEIETYRETVEIVTVATSIEGGEDQLAASFKAGDPTARWVGFEEVDVQLGTAYISDVSMAREDYVAGLISRPEALRQRGRTDEEILLIETEITADQSVIPEVSIPTVRAAATVVAK